MWITSPSLTLHSLSPAEIINRHALGAGAGPPSCIYIARSADPRQDAKAAYLNNYTLNLKCMTSPSLTMYSLPSSRNLPASLAPASPL
jgi:hypothetical protein